MICRENNSTKTTILGSFSKDTNREKLCLCDEDNGWMENLIENHCSGKFITLNIKIGVNKITLRVIKNISFYFLYRPSVTAAVKNFIASIFGYIVAVIFYFAITQKVLHY